MMDIGLLVIRLVVGGLVVGHGLQKVAGWFGGPGVRGNAAFLERLGFRRSQIWSWLHGGAEVAAGLALALGLATPFAAAALLAVMVLAGWLVHRPNGLWSQDGGWEYPLVISASAVGIALSGPGGWALDSLLGWSFGPIWTMAALVGGVLLAVLVAVTRGGRRRAAGDVDEQAPGRPSLVDAA